MNHLWVEARCFGLGFILTQEQSLMARASELVSGSSLPWDGSCILEGLQRALGVRGALCICLPIPKRWRKSPPTPREWWSPCWAANQPKSSCKVVAQNIRNSKVQANSPWSHPLTARPWRDDSLS